MTDIDVAVSAEADLGEGPTWDPAAGHLIWVDILSCQVHTHDPSTGAGTLLKTEQHVGAAKPRAGGGLVVNLRDGIGLYGPEPDRSFRWLHHEPVDGRRGNDAAVAPDGALWAGTMRYDQAPGGGTLTRIAPDGTADTVLPDVTISNGTGWSPDGRRMYYVDTPTHRIDVFDVVDAAAAADAVDMADSAGTAGTDRSWVRGRRPLVEVEEGAGSPDGLAVDADGCIWVALWDGAAVRRYTPDGRLDRVVPLPVPRPTSCAFGGPELSDLYITTARVGIDPDTAPLAGSLLVIPGAGCGLPQPPFAG